jgi:ATP phosphoribosyltransferase-like protein
MNYLNIAGYPVCEPDRSGFCGKTGNVEFFQFDRRMIPYFLNVGFHAGITGKDIWIDSCEDELLSVGTLNFSRSLDKPSRWVLIKRKDVRLEDIERPVRIGCELPGLLGYVFRPFCPNIQINLGSYVVRRIEGSEEQCVVHGIVDLALVVTDTGESISANNLEIIPKCEELFVSTPCILSRKDVCPELKEELEALTCALKAVVGAQSNVLVVFDIPSDVDLDKLGLPFSVAPTVAPLTDVSWKSVSICIPREQFGHVARKIKFAGGKSIELQNFQGHLS